MTVLYVVGGFLGSGKTTAIAAAARVLLADGQRVGVITNDQGKYLVDTAFFQAERLPTVEVTGGCFCCNYDDLDSRFAELQARYQPDVVFAESVGSCADVVATVIKPLLELSARPASLSVFADSRLLFRRLRGDELPFADDVVYIFDKQLEEADLVVVNKIDLLSEADQAELVERAERSLPGKRILLHSAYEPNSTRRWLDALAVSEASARRTSLDIDYQRYGGGEADLAWLDAEIELRLCDADRRDLVQAFLVRLEHQLSVERIPIGHLKLVVADGDTQAKFSLTAINEPGWEATVPLRRSNHLTLLLNLRAQTEANRLEAAARAALADALGGGEPARWSAQYFQPGFPKPTHRLP
ncbi:MAG: hypothetical protein IAE80_27710 [Anaerolinea sp.]|nr:hypothetical protein [Anaerolinea sp.]